MEDSRHYSSVPTADASTPLLGSRSHLEITSTRVDHERDWLLNYRPRRVPRFATEAQRNACGDHS